MDVIVMFGGGGSLGAFDCGVWNVLAPLLRDRGARVVGIGGASIGAVNAACIARYLPDLCGSSHALHELWCERFSTPSYPFAELSGSRDARSWSGVLTGLLMGARNLYHSNWTQWNPLAGLDRVDRPLMDRTAMWDILEARIGTLSAPSQAQPLLCVPAVDVVSGDLVLFDNGAAPIGPAHLAAGSAIPLLFEPVVIDGRLYWDADMTRESALPLMLDRLRQRGRLQDDAGDGQVLLITVDHMPRGSVRAPRSGVEMAYRALNLFMHGKMHLDAPQLGGITHLLPIVREPLENDAISAHFDYSPQRIDELVSQGQHQAELAWLSPWLEARPLEVPLDRAKRTRHAAGERRAMH